MMSTVELPPISTHDTNIVSSESKKFSKYYQTSTQPRSRSIVEEDNSDEETSYKDDELVFSPNSDSSKLSGTPQTSPKPESPNMNNTRKTYQTTSSFYNTENLVFFDSVVVEFSIFRFFHQLAVHLLHPLLIVTVNADVQAFTTWTPGTLLFGIFHPLCVYLLIIMYFLSNDKEIEGAATVPLLYYVLHKIVVATKYACLSETEYERLEKSSKKIGERYRRQVELISGWLRRDQIVLDFELGAAIIRSGLRPSSKIEIRISRSSKPQSYDKMNLNTKLWHNYLRYTEIELDLNQGYRSKLFYTPLAKANAENPMNNSTRQSEENKEDQNGANVETIILSSEGIPIHCHKDGTFISIFDVCTAVIQRSDEQNYFFEIFDKGNIILSGFNCFLIFIPLIGDDADGNNHHLNYASIIFYFCAVTIAFTYFGIVFQFMYVGVFDIARQLVFLKSLNTMIRVNDVSKDVEINFKMSNGQETDEQSFLQREIINRVITRRRNRRRKPTEKRNQSYMDHVSSHDNFYRISVDDSFAAQTIRDINKASAHHDINPMLTSTQNKVILDAWQQNRLNKAINQPGQKKTSDPNDASERSMDINNVPGSHESAKNDQVTISDDSHSHNAKELLEGDDGISLSRRNFNRNREVNSVRSVIPEWMKKRESVQNNTAILESCIPKLRLDIAENVIGWTYMRLILYRFGARFRFRLQTYSIIIIAVFVVMIGLILWMLITEEDTKSVLDAIYFRQLMLAVTLIFIYLSLLVWTGSQVNSSLDDHITTLSSHLLRNQLKIIELKGNVRSLEMNMRSIDDSFVPLRSDAIRSTSPNLIQEDLVKSADTQNDLNIKNPRRISIRTTVDSKTEERIEHTKHLLTKKLAIKDELDKNIMEIENLVNANEALNQCIGVLKESNDHDPFTVLGVEAQPALLTSLLSGAVGFFVFVYRYYNPTGATEISSISSLG